MVEPLAYRLMVCFCLSLQEMTTSLLDGIFVREEWKRSLGWIRQIAEEFSYRLKARAFHTFIQGCPKLLMSLGGIHKLAGYC